MRPINRLEGVGDTWRTAVHRLATGVPAWINGRALLEWDNRDASHMENGRLPKEKRHHKA
jgi:hypothetical protein